MPSADTSSGNRFAVRLLTYSSLFLVTTVVLHAQQGVDVPTMLPEVTVAAPPVRIAPPPAVEQARPAPARRAKRTARNRRPAPAAPGPAPVAAPAVAAAVKPSDITVSATTTALPVDTVGSTVTVITRAELEAQQRRTLPDALNQVPGLNVVQTGGPGGQTSVFIRGTNSNHVKVLVDGIEVNDPSNPNGSFDFGQLLTYDVDRIEVLRGPQSGLYGSDALGGVISVFTKRGEGPPKVTARMEGGSFGTFNQAISLSGGAPQQYDYSFNFAHFLAGNVPVTPPELTIPFNRRTIGNAYDNYSVSAKIGVDLNDFVRVNAVGRYLNTRLLFTGTDYSVYPPPSPPNIAQSDQRDEQMWGRAEVLIKPWGDLFISRLGASALQAQTFDKEPDTIYGFTPPTTNLGTRSKLDYQGILNFLPGQQLIGGAETQVERMYILPDVSTYIANGPSTTVTKGVNRNSAVYLQYAGTFFDRAFIAANVRHDDNERFGGHNTFRIAPSLRLPGSETLIKTSYGTGFKAPTLNQLYVSYPAFGFYANPNLLPETSTGYDIGVEQPLPFAGVKFGATYFQNNIKNLINTSSDGRTYVNVGQAKTFGVESFISMSPWDTLTMRVDYTFTRAWDQIAQQELLRRPLHKGSFNAIWKPMPGLTLSATVVAIGRFVDGNRDFSVPRLWNNGHTTANFAGEYAINDNVKAFARLDNALDLRYQDPTGFLQPGRAAYAGLQMTY